MWCGSTSEMYITQMRELKQFLELLADRLETEEEKAVNLKIDQYKLSIKRSREKIVKNEHSLLSQQDKIKPMQRTFWVFWMEKGGIDIERSMCGPIIIKEAKVQK
ncbi:rCG35590 [Rattus norvegicus]|uniref:RCG35590 n=1 Tax=Rattus norvegicus TaxID=10116 RepID=A6HKI1_RAT|nr:rCG35590 [Rattus norvegicus]